MGRVGDFARPLDSEPETAEISRMRMRLLVPLSSACLVSLVGCSGPGTDQDAGATSFNTGVESAESAETGNEGNENSNSNGDGDPGDGDPGDGDPGDGDGDPGDGDPEGGGSHKWDLAPIPDSSNQGCGVGGGGPEFSYIFIANSGQGTMTKLNTDTMIEEGRYRMRPDGGGSPSRTSVALSGNVAIAARDGGGGVTKFWANPDDCEESNGMPGIQTSSGANDILAWDVEECHAWHQPFVGKNYWTNRPMAWAPGDLNEGSCTWHDEMLWTSGTGNQVEVILLNGDTGDIAETIPIPQMNGGMMYGGAVDGDGNFWGLEYGTMIVRVDRENFTVEDWAIPGGPGYGIAVDVQGRVWTCGDGHASRFDPDTEQWQTTPGGVSGGIGGCMTDGATTLYHSRYPDGIIVAIDTESVLPIGEFVIPDYVHGISVDFTGKVWGVTFGGSQTYRLDVETAEVLTYGGLTGAYTYSDMTGFGLSSVAQPSG
jgi:hypothetical protein